MLKRNKQERVKAVNSQPPSLVEMSTQPGVHAIEPITKSLISQVMAELGRRGGKIGGKRRLQTMSAKQRVQVAKKAAEARWKKKEE